jgi:hypothetical protein
VLPLSPRATTAMSAGPRHHRHAFWCAPERAVALAAAALLLPAALSRATGPSPTLASEAGATTSPPAAAVNYDALIAQAHAAAAKNRAELLGTYTWAPDAGAGATQCPDGPNDVCHARKCIHCGCHGGSPRCPPPTAPPSSPQVYPGCPNQVQCSAMPTAIATLSSNTNATAVAGVNRWLEANFLNTSSDWWRTTLNGPSLKMTRFSGCPLENSYSVAMFTMFTMFNSQSRWVKAGTVAQLSPGAEKGMKAFFLQYVEDCARLSPGEAKRYPLFLHDSENIDTVRHTGCYFGSATLALFPDTANHTLSDKTSVYETAAAWEQFTWKWLKAKALHGFFDELGSSGYWTRTWPCVWNLHTLSQPGSRVRRRAKMFIDLAMLEAELSAINGVRGRRAATRKARPAWRCATAAPASSTRASAVRPASWAPTRRSRTTCTPRSRHSSTATAWPPPAGSTPRAS